MSSPSLFSSPFPSPSPPSHRSTFRSVQRHTPPHRDHLRFENRPRLSSPHHFRDYFLPAPDSDQRRQAVLPPARRPSGQGDEHSFADAIQRTTRAMRSTGEAFQSRAGTSRFEVVDLTDSPPAENRSTARPNSRDRRDDFATTTHPQDSRHATRGLSTLHEPIFGYQPIFTSGPPQEDPTDSLVRARNRRARATAQVNSQAARRQADERAERDAIRRQQENHATWQRTQERLRQQQEEQDDPEQISSISSTPSPSSLDSLFDSSRLPTPDTMPSTEKIESVDLTEVNDDNALAETLAKQRADAIAAQRPNTSTDAGRTTFTAYKCPICMDNIKDATSTICGHLFCHRCIIDTLNWSANQRKHETGINRKVNGVCPVCRKPLGIRDQPNPYRTLVTLELKFLTKKRKREDKGKGRADDYQPKGKAKKPKRESTEEFFSAVVDYSG